MKNAKQIIVSNIQWDAPKSANLPDNVMININDDNADLLEDIDGYADNLSDYLSDTYEYCHEGFSVDIITDLKETAECIVAILADCGFDDVTDSSGYFVIKEFDDNTDRAVDVYKSTNGGNPHYIIYCSYEDDSSDYAYTDDLSVDSLIKKLEELCA